LCAVLRDKIRLKENPVQLIRMFHDLYQKSDEHDPCVHMRDARRHQFSRCRLCIESSDRILACYHRLLLCAATEHEHIELVRLMLSNKRADHDSRLEHTVPRPLFTAIYTGNVKLVQMFLQAGSRMSLVSPDPMHLSDTVTWYENYSQSVHVMEERREELILSNRMYDDDEEEHLNRDTVVSALEYACLLNKTEVLKTMVAFDNTNKHIRYVTTFSIVLVKSFLPTG